MAPATSVDEQGTDFLEMNRRSVMNLYYSEYANKEEGCVVNNLKYLLLKAHSKVLRSDYTKAKSLL